MMVSATIFREPFKMIQSTISVSLLIASIFKSLLWLLESGYASTIFE